MEIHLKHDFTYFSVNSLVFLCFLVSRYRHSQRPGGRIATASDGLQGPRPRTQASQTHRAPSRDVCMNWMMTRPHGTDN